MHGLRAQRYGLWASQGREFSKELIAQMPLILHLSPSYFEKHRLAHIPLCALWRRSSLRSLPTRAIGSALCVMGGQLWFLDHVCSSYMCTGSSTRHYGIRASQGQEPSNKLTAQTLLIPCINVLGLITCLFSPQMLASHLNMHTTSTYNIYTNTQMFA